ncbi:hypothetical protein SLA2020_060810 [Shorea laevis]
MEGRGKGRRGIHAVQQMTPRGLFPWLSFPPKSIPRAITSLAARLGDIDTFTEKSGYLFDLSASEADLLTDYNVSIIASIYKRKPLILLRHLLQIGLTFGKWFGDRYVDTVMDRSDQMFKVWIDIDFVRNLFSVNSPQR